MLGIHFILTVVLLSFITFCKANNNNSSQSDSKEDSPLKLASTSSTPKEPVDKAAFYLATATAVQAVFQNYEYNKKFSPMPYDFIPEGESLFDQLSQSVASVSPQELAMTLQKDDLRGSLKSDYAQLGIGSGSQLFLVNTKSPNVKPGSPLVVGLAKRLKVSERLINGNSLTRLNEFAVYLENYQKLIAEQIDLLKQTGQDVAVTAKNENKLIMSPTQISKFKGEIADIETWLDDKMRVYDIDRALDPGEIAELRDKVAALQKGNLVGNEFPKTTTLEQDLQALLDLKSEIKFSQIEAIVPIRDMNFRAEALKNPAIYNRARFIPLISSSLGAIETSDLYVKMLAKENTVIIESKPVVRACMVFAGPPPPPTVGRMFAGQVVNLPSAADHMPPAHSRTASVGRAPTTNAVGRGGVKEEAKVCNRASRSCMEENVLAPIGKFFSNLWSKIFLDDDSSSTSLPSSATALDVLMLQLGDIESKVINTNLK